MNIHTEILKESDIEDIIALENECFAHPWPRSAFEEILTGTTAEYYAAKDDEGRLLGGAALFFLSGEGDITNVAVHGIYRNNGIATKLLEDMIEDGRKRGLTEFTLETRESNLAAIAVYEKNGFVVEGRRPGFYRDPKEDALVMWLR
ncbi:MAG: ribosomal protein S18-alanine N-acetyltransferase [Lachnospiraceae bacterium]|nr:ribosomal protein S18-alanine N-acetyltransferase [Lachnospiraceae bacterium]